MSKAEWLLGRCPMQVWYVKFVSKL
jgi:hypothetical protein